MCDSALKLLFVIFFMNFLSQAKGMGNNTSLELHKFYLTETKIIYGGATI